MCYASKRPHHDLVRCSAKLTVGKGVHLTFVRQICARIYGIYETDCEQTNGVQLTGGNCRALHQTHHSAQRRHPRSVPRSNCLRIRKIPPTDFTAIHSYLNTTHRHSPATVTSRSLIRSVSLRTGGSRHAFPRHFVHASPNAVSPP